MPFDFAALKKHPYAVGGVVIVGALGVFYVLSRNSASSVSGVATDNSGVAAADASLGQAQAAAAIQTNAQNAAIQTASINASSTDLQTNAAESVANNQTVASLIAALSGNKTTAEVTQSNNDAATLQASNAEIAQQNIYQLQEEQLTHQYDIAAQEQANNNSTNLAGLVDTLNYQGQIATQVIGGATQLALQQQANTQANTQALIPTFGKQYNSALDANNAAAEILTVLSGNNAGVANSGVQSSTVATQSGNAANSSNIAAITNGVAKVGSSIASGFFG